MSAPRQKTLTIPRALARVSLGMSLGALLACPDEGDDGPIAECPILADEASCERGSGCAWDPRDLECVVDCARIDAMAPCDDQEACFWEGGTCHYGIA